MYGLIAGILAVFAGGVLLTSKGRALVKGFFGIFVEDVSKTPAGARATFDAALDKNAKELSKASDSYAKATGLLNNVKARKEKMEKDIKEYEVKCSLLLDKGDEDSARLYAGKRQQIVEKLPEIEKQIENYTKLKESANEMVKLLKDQRSNLEISKDETITQLEMNIQTKEMYKNMSKIHTDGSKKLLEEIKKDVENNMYIADGYKDLYENSLDRKIAKVDDMYASKKADDFLADLKSKKAIK